MKHKIFLAFLLFSFYSSAQIDQYSIGGYAKYLFSSVKYTQLGNREYDHLLHTRLNTKWYPSQNITGTFEFDFEHLPAEVSKIIQTILKLIKTYQPLMDLDVFLWNNKTSIGYLEADRIYFDYYAGDLQTTIGRQRIAWGTSWVWNPLDIFNPRSVLDFDHEELPGADALRFQYYTGPMGKVELALAPAREKRNSSYAFLITQNAFDYDFNFMAGIKKDRWIIGTAWSGDILEAGFRGEITLSQNPNRVKAYDSLYSAIGAEAISANQDKVLSFVLSGDYTFPNSFYIHTEVLFNSNGKTKNTGLFNQEALSLGMLSASKWSVYQEFSYDITPLMRGSIFAIIDPNDNSFVFVPAVSYSIITNLDLYFIGLLFSGNHLAEYGDQGNYIYARLKWSF